MKKLMALLLALMLALSCVGASAEATPDTFTAHMTMSVNEELFSALLPLFAEKELTEAEQQLLSLLLSMANNLGVTCVVADNGMQADVTLKDVPVATVVGVAGDEGMALMSDLFPSYALTMPADLMPKATNMQPDEAMLQSLEAHLSTLMNGFSAYAGQPEVGEYTLDGGVFNVKQPYNMTQKDAALLVINWLKGLMADEALAPLFAAITSAAAAEGETFDAATLDQAIADLEAMTDEELMPVDVATYAVVDENGQAGEDFYFTASMGDDEKVMAVAFGQVQTILYGHFAFGDAVFSSLGEMRQAAAEGKGEAFTLDVAFFADQTQGTMAFGMDFYMNGMYIALTLQGAETEYGLAEEVALYFMSTQAPLLTLSALIMPEGMLTASMSPEGKTMLPLEAVLADEEGTLSKGLEMDVMTFGLNSLLANAATAMPEEVNALITLLSPPAQDASTTPVESIPNDAQAPVEGVENDTQAPVVGAPQ